MYQKEEIPSSTYVKKSVIIQPIDIKVIIEKEKGK